MWDPSDPLTSALLGATAFATIAGDRLAARARRSASAPTPRTSATTPAGLVVVAQSPSGPSYLESLPLLTDGTQGVVMAHGALADPRRYVSSDGDAAQQLAELRAGRRDAAMLLLGHTHAPMVLSQVRKRLRVVPGDPLALPAGERVLLNPGSVGQSRQRHARAQALILDCGERTATFLELDYDVRACRRELRRRGLTRDAHHRRPYGARDMERRVRSVARRVRDAVRR